MDTGRCGRKVPGGVIREKNEGWGSRGGLGMPGPARDDRSIEKDQFDKFA